jgi:holo-[acyl-carrier protein] synthase
MIGIGTDLVDLDRFRQVLERTPSIVDRLFTDGEQAYARKRRDPTQPLGARFAAKEATMKALGIGLGEIRFREIEVTRLDSGAPRLVLHGGAADLAAGRGVVRWLITISHTDHLAQAVVVAMGAAADAGREDAGEGAIEELDPAMARRIVQRAMANPLVREQMTRGRPQP